MYKNTDKHLHYSWKQISDPELGFNAGELAAGQSLEGTVNLCVHINEAQRRVTKRF